MTFSSPIFLFCFFPIVFLLYALIPNRFLRLRNALLIVASLLFYGWGEPFAMLLMLGVVFLSYCTALGIGHGGIIRKIAYPLGIIGDLSVLCIYKYADFFIGSFNAVSGLHLPLPHLSLPIGISFFIFQAVSYLIDTARKEVPPQRNFFKLLLYISFFPQLVAGPIVRYQTIAEALESRQFSLADITSGLRRMILGLSKKLLLADTLGQIADTAFSMENSLSLPIAWLGAICYTLQIYYDFSGYSDMAIGMGRMFGFAFDENFDYPYISCSITEFWKRWHISLTTWFRSYLYIPLGGNRKGNARTILNKWVVFFCTGLWHGASWNFILWGLLNGALMTLEQIICKGKKPRRRGFFMHLYTMLAVCLAFVLFRADNLTQAVCFYRTMFYDPSLSMASLTHCTQLLSPLVIVTLLLAILFATPILRIGIRAVAQKSKDAAVVCTSLGALVLLLLCMMNVAASNYHPFIYFRF